MIIKNLRVYTPAKNFVPGEIIIHDGKIAAEAFPNEEVIDGGGAYAVPGLIDIHFHGCKNADFCDADPEGIQKIADYELAEGITTIVPATMTLSEDELVNIMETADQAVLNGGSKFAGINMEGPFISAAKKGAQAATNIRTPNTEEYKKLQKASGNRILICDLAPETEGAMDFIKENAKDVCISFAHTTADYDTASKGYALGARHATHLYNAMPPFAHRDPGVIGAAADNENVRVELIADGVHIHPSVVRQTFKMFGDDRVILISDSMRATGMPDGMYSLGGQRVRKTGNRAELADGDSIAGSVTNLADCVRSAVLKMGIPLETAVAAATMNPAKEVGLYEDRGSLESGKAADILLLNPADLSTKAVYLDGKLVK